MRKDFFWGLVSVCDWEWLWGRTAAQIELRTLDQPIVVYKADKDKEKPWKNGTVSGSYANKQYQKWLEGKKRREKDGSQIDFDKVFENSTKIDMNALLKNGEVKEKH